MKYLTRLMGIGILSSILFLGSGCSNREIDIKSKVDSAYPTPSSNLELEKCFHVCWSEYEDQLKKCNSSRFVQFM